MKDYPNARDCKHGQLRRSCEICYLEKENKYLLEEIKKLRTELKKLRGE